MSMRLRTLLVNIQSLVVLGGHLLPKMTTQDTTTAIAMIPPFDIVMELCSPPEAPARSPFPSSILAASPACAPPCWIGFVIAAANADETEAILAICCGEYEAGVASRALVVINSSALACAAAKYVELAATARLASKFEDRILNNPTLSLMYAPM